MALNCQATQFVRAALRFNSIFDSGTIRDRIADHYLALRAVFAYDFGSIVIRFGGKHKMSNTTLRHVKNFLNGVLRCAESLSRFSIPSPLGAVSQ